MKKIFKAVKSICIFTFLAIIFSSSLFTFSTVSFANTCMPSVNNICQVNNCGCCEITRNYCGFLPNAIQMALVANAGMSIGFIHYDEYYSYGINLAGKAGKTDNKNTRIFTPSLFVGGRYPLGCSTHFAYGIDLSTKVGKEHGENVNSNIGTGPYISLDYDINDCLILTGWIEPYSYQYEKIGIIQSRTHSFFNTGGIGISYYFN
jgi:hypothetical protein